MENINFGAVSFFQYTCLNNTILKNICSFVFSLWEFFSKWIIKKSYQNHQSISNDVFWLMTYDTGSRTSDCVLRRQLVPFLCQIWQIPLVLLHTMSQSTRLWTIKGDLFWNCGLDQSLLCFPWPRLYWTTFIEKLGSTYKYFGLLGFYKKNWIPYDFR